MTCTTIEPVRDPTQSIRVVLIDDEIAEARLVTRRIAEATLSCANDAPDRT